MRRLQAGLRQRSGWPTLLHNAVQSCHPITNTQDSEHGTHLFNLCSVSVVANAGMATARRRSIFLVRSIILIDAEAASRAKTASCFGHLAVLITVRCVQYMSNSVEQLWVDGSA